MTTRTPQDYALEHAEYAMQAAERAIEADNDLYGAAKAMDDLEGDEDVEIYQAAEERLDQARETQSDAMRSLQNRIYEFRKRRDRAVAASLQSGWTSVNERLPPCTNDQDYIGINSAGFAGIFNAIADIAGNVHCMMETAEESVSIMSDLSIWKPFTRPLPLPPSTKGESTNV